MKAKRKVAAIIGILFLLAAITSIIGVMLYIPILSNSNYIIKAPIQETQILWGAFFEIILALSVVGTAIMLYPVLKDYNESLALGAVCFRTLESAIIIIGILCLLTITALNHGYSATLEDKTEYQMAGKLLLAMHNWTFLFGPNLLLGPSTMITAFLLYRSKLVPRPVAIFGLIGGPLIFICAILVIFGVFSQVSIWGALFALPVFGYEMSLTIWLVTKGFNVKTLKYSTVKN